MNKNFTQEEIYGQSPYENDNITGNQGNANQNHNKMQFYLHLIWKNEQSGNIKC